MVLARAARGVAVELDLDLAPGAEAALPNSLPDWPPFPEVPGALTRLRAEGWRLAVLSNVDPDLLASSLRAIGVPVDETVTVAEAGSYKPAHGHWRAFFARTGASPAGHVHVAASLFHGIAPCAELGLWAVWINRSRCTRDLPRAAELPTCTDLADTLAHCLPRRDNLGPNSRLLIQCPTVPGTASTEGWSVPSSATSVAFRCPGGRVWHAGGHQGRTRWSRRQRPARRAAAMAAASSGWLGRRSTSS